MMLIFSVFFTVKRSVIKSGFHHFLCLGVCTLVFTFSSGQIITDSVTTRFVKDKLISLDQKIYAAALESRIPAYRDETLKNHIPVHKLPELGTSLVLIYNEQNLADSAATVPLNPETDFSGMHLTWSTERLKDDIGTVDHLFSIAPTYIESVEDVKYKPKPLFWVKVSDLKYILTESDLTFLKYATNMRLILGPSPAMVHVLKNPKYPMKSSSRNRLIYQFENNLTELELGDSISDPVGTYLHLIPSLLVYRISQTYNANPTTPQPLFKDKKLKENYTYVWRELGSARVLRLPQDTTHVIYIDTASFLQGGFSGNFDFRIHRSGHDMIFEVLVPQKGQVHSVFFSLEMLGYLLDEQEIRLMEALGKSTFK